MTARPPRSTSAEGKTKGEDQAIDVFTRVTRRLVKATNLRNELQGVHREERNNERLRVLH
jgi:hypothetical protein